MNLKPLFILIFVGFLGLLGFNLFKSHKTETVMSETAAIAHSAPPAATNTSSSDIGERQLAEFKKRLPYTDGNVRIDNAFMDANKVIRIQGSLINESFSGVNSEEKAKVMKIIKEQAIEQGIVCKSSDMKALLNAQYTLVYMFFDKSQNSIGEVTFTADDCKDTH